MSSKHIKLLLVHLSLFGIFLAYQNCSPGFQVDTASVKSLASISYSTPEISFSEIPEFVTTNDVTINFAVKPSEGDVIESVRCKLETEVEDKDCSSGSVTFPALEDGGQILKVSVRTTETGLTEKSIGFRKDSQAPSITVSSAPAMVTNSTTANFVFMTSDGLSGVRRVECSVGNLEFTECSSPFQVSALAAGQRNVRIRVTDMAGNVSTPYSHTWTIDTSVPSVTIASSPAAFTNSTTAVLTFSGTGIVSYQCQLNNQPFTACTSPHTYTNVTANSAHIFRVRGTNLAGTVSGNSEARWTIDTLVPSDLRLTASVPALTQSRSAIFTFTATDVLAGIARYECSSDAATTYTTCVSPRTINNLADGPHSFRYRAVDNAGNTSNIGSFEWRVDGTAPTLTFSQTPPATTTSTSATFAFTANDGGSGLASTQCSLGSANFANCSSPYDLNSLPPGPQVFRVRASDQAGNQTTISHQWTVSLAPTPTPTPNPTPTPPPNGAILARVTATRISGPAPLAVLFDASTSTAPGVSLPFHQLRYEYDFGDNRGLTWTHSGLAKNTQNGAPIAAHIFDNPGTYVVRVRVRNPMNSDASDATITITVQDPATVYSGANTTCVSTSGNFTGCPAGAVQQTTLPSVYGNRRTLLRRGDTFGGVEIRRVDDGARVESFGTGNKPNVASVFINGGQLNTGFADDVTVMDLNVLNGISHSDSGSRYLIYRNDLINPGGNNSITFAGALEYYYERNQNLPFYNPHEIFIVENRVIGQVNNTQNPFMNLSGSGSRIVLMGNELMRSQEHTVRFFALHKSVIAHNAIRGQSWGDGPTGSGPSIRGCLKIHSGGLRAYTDDYASSGAGAWATSQLVLANNVLGDAANNGYFTGGVSSQNRDASTVEGVEDVVIENNRFTRGPNTNTELENVGRRITTRGNVRTDGGPINLSIGTPSPSLPAEWFGPFFRE